MALEPHPDLEEPYGGGDAVTVRGGEESAAGVPRAANPGRSVLLGGGDEGEGTLLAPRVRREVPGSEWEGDVATGGAVVGDADAAI